MNIGRRRRARSARSTSPLPRIGSDEAVHDTTMSYSCSCSAQRAAARSRCAVEAVREALGALERAVGDRDARRRLRGEVRGAQLDHLAGADEQHALVLEAREDARRELHRGGGHRHAGRADAAWSCALPWPPRRSAGTACAARVPSVPADSAARAASFIWPRICGSPSTIESRPEATRNAWRTACSLRQRVQVAAAARPARGGGTAPAIAPARRGSSPAT